ncbi:MAG: glycosyltransferase family 4 protein [Porticoccus sp.]|nr:glycosyltransferase family 4 protein [Porticoccus sp.]
MNIGFIGNIPPPVGGAEVFLQGFLDRFIGDGRHRGTQLRWARQDFYYGSQTEITQYAPMGHCDIKGDLATYYLFDSMAEHAGQRAKMSQIYTEQSIEATRLLGHHQVELVHAHCLGNLPFAAYAARNLNIPLVITVHGHVEFKNLEKFHASRPEFIQMFYDCLAQAALVIAVSDEISEACRQRGANRVEKLSCGIDTRLFSPSDEEQRLGNDIVFVGSLREDKGALLLIKAFMDVAETLDCDLILVGRIMIEGTLVEAAVRHPRIRFLGCQDADTVRGALANAKLVVLPSESEGTPLSIIEAMSFMRPVLASNTGELGNIIKHGHNGFLLAQRTEEELASSLLSITSRDDLEIVGRRARKTALEFDIDDVVKKHENIYQSLLNKA